VVVLRLRGAVRSGGVPDLVRRPAVGVQEEGRDQGDFAGQEERGDGVGQVVDGEVRGWVKGVRGFEDAEDELGRWLVSALLQGGGGMKWEGETNSLDEVEKYEDFDAD
jgi:hypothetical protein